MTMFRMPIFTWNMLVTGILILIAFPVLTGALVMLFADRHFGTHIFTVTGCHLVTRGRPTVVAGQPLLWQNLFWFFGHPEVYILALPFFGIVTEVLPVFSRKPVFGYKGMVFATMAIAALSTGVWAHHMFTTGAVLLPFFSFLSLLIAVPTGIKFFNWIGTMWHGQLEFTTPMLFCLGFLLAFLMGGVTGIMLASPPDRLRHPRHLLRGGPLPSGALRHGGPGRVRRVLLLVSQDVRPDVGRHARQVALLAAVHRVLAHLHAPVHRRTQGHATTGGQLSFEPRLAGVQRAVDDRRVHHRRSPSPSCCGTCGNRGANPFPPANNPWDAHTLEWFTTSPPPHHNYTHLPPIRSERPTWDYNHPDALSVPHGIAAEAAAKARRREPVA